VSNVPPPAGLRGAVDLSALVRRANAPQPPAGAGDAAAASANGGAPAAPGLVLPATDASFDSILELSNRVPVVVEFYAPGIEPALGRMIATYGGRLVLATVDGQANPQLAQAFQVREVPAVAAVIGGRPVNLFLGIPSDEEVRQVFDELLALAQQNGITGTVPVEPPADGAQAAPAEPMEEPLPPHHQEAYDAISDGDYATAIDEYSKAIAQNPRDALAVAGLAQVSLLQRLDGLDADAVRAAATASPADVAAQLAVADLDLSAGSLEDAFARLLDLFPTLDADGKNAVRTRLLEFFEIGGADDERVIAARRRLTNLLY
jgi:putative thioredoxin